MKWTSILSTTTLIGAALAADVSDCSCGFIDTENDQVWTDALIVYFNETQAVPDDFKIQDFTHRREYGWNTLYRQGALSENVLMDYASNGTNSQMDTLALFIDQSHGNHLVYGAAIEAKRQDMRFGSFQASMRGPPKNTGGSAMSMMLQFNRTSNIEIDMCNMDDPTDARFLSLKDGEFPSSAMTTNYTVAANGSSGLDPWDFVETRIDWGKHSVNWTIGESQTRTTKRKGVDVSEPLPLIFKHWSIGDSYWMEGPPSTRNQANVAWVRAFFNSSLTTKAEQKDFDDRCRLAVTCSINDTALRGSTTYADEALVPWKEPAGNHAWRKIAGTLAGAFFGFGCLTLINVVLRRIPWRILIGKRKGKLTEKPPPQLSSPSPYAAHLLGESKQSNYGSHHQSSSLRDSGSSAGSSSTSPPASSEDTRKKSLRWQDPFNPSEKSGARASSSAYQRTFSQSQPTDWRKKSLAYHGSLPDIVPPESATARKSISVQFKNDAEQSGFRPRNESVFQSIRSRAGSTMHAISEVIAQGNTTENQRQKSADLRSSLLPEEEEESSKSKKTATFEVAPIRAPSLIARDFALEQTSFQQQRGRQASVLERHRDHHFTDAGSRHSYVSFNMKDWNTQGLHEVDHVDPLHESQIKGPRRITLAEAVPVAAVDIPLPKQKAHEERIDHLAGLVAFSSLGVTLIHFFLTFSPYAGGLDYGQHYDSEYWARWTVEPAFLNPIWLGPFFLTSCRFLCSRFLQNGDLSAVAEKMLLRAPRMIIPCVLVAALEYFFLEQGFMVWLQWLPSISWSEWPYITVYGNFGVFLNSMLELAYLIPNAAPQVVSHYCTGVLWSIPVQLQFSFITLLAVVIIRDIKDPRKRFGIYTWCIIANWYSLSWGSCFWAGLALADLQITYKFSENLQKKPFWSLIFCISMWIVAFASAAMTLLEDRLQIPTLSSEHDVHPDFYTGKRLGETSSKGYPAYYEPRLNTLTFSIAMQLLIETSTWFQAFLSLRFWQPIFPHAFTIYLVHGFIWWSLGSYMVVQIGSRGTPYWAVLLSTAIVCYFTLALTVVALSFFTGTVTAAACRNIARWAMEPEVPKQRTLEPFRADLFLERNKEPGEFQDEEARGVAPAAATATRPGFQRAPATTDSITNAWQMDFKDRSKSLEEIELEEVDPREAKSIAGSLKSRRESEESYHDNAN